MASEKVIPQPRRPRTSYNVPVKNEELLSDDMKAAIRAKALEEVQKARKEEAAKEYLEKCKDEELNRAEAELADTWFDVDVPGYTQVIRIDGRVYDQGQRYLVSKSQADSMREIQHNAWRHEASNGGAHMKEYRPPVTDAQSAMRGTSMHKLTRV